MNTRRIWRRKKWRRKKRKKKKRRKKRSTLSYSERQQRVWSVCDFIFLASVYEGRRLVLSIVVSSSYRQFSSYLS